jgi:multidrug efflux system membrane fusion protein
LRFASRPATILIALAVAALIAVMLLRHPSPARDLTREGSASPVAIAVAKATLGDIQVSIPALGTIAPIATVTVKTQISGQLQKIAFVEGQSVAAGDFLAQIDPRPYEATLRQMQANLHRDQALLVNARLDLKRYQGLLAEDSIAEQQLATQKALVQQYEGSIEGDRAEAYSAALNLKYTRILAPISGRVGLRQVDEGNYVTANDANGIVVITQSQPISALFSIPEDNTTTIMQRLHDGTTLRVEAYDRGDTDKLADGRVSAADNEIDAATGTFKLRALFDNQDGHLIANEFVNIRLLVNDLRNQIIVPMAAVHRGAPGGSTSTFVYRVNGDSTVTVRPIVLGVADGDNVAVTGGLAAGDVVVTEGGDRLRDGAPVLLPNARLAGAMPANRQHQHRAKKTR